MIEYMVYTKALHTVKTKAVSLLPMGSQVKMTKYHQDLTYFSNLFALSQLTFRISVGKVPFSPCLIVAATIDCILSRAWIQLRARETLFWASPSASTVIWWWLSLIPSH